MPYWYYNCDEFGGEYDSKGEILLSFPDKFLSPNYEVKDSCKEISEEAICSLKFINSCSGKEFCNRNKHLEVKMSLKHKYLWAIGTVDKKVWISKVAERYLRNFMKQPNAKLKEAISHCNYNELIIKNQICKKISLITYNEQEKYPIRLNSITIPAKVTVYKTIKMLLSLFDTVYIKFDNDNTLKLSAKEHNKPTTFYSPLVKDNAIEIENNAEEEGIELENYKIDEYGVCYSTDGKSLLKAPSGLQFYIVKDSVEIIDYRAFANCIDLKLVVLPPHLKTLGVECFYNCRNLLYIYLPNSIKEICESIFDNCHSLKTIEYPNKLDFLSFDIHNCNNIQSIMMPVDVENIKIFEGFGYNCKSLEKIKIPRGQLFKYRILFPWIKREHFLDIFEEYVKEGCRPGRDIRYREIALDYCKFWQKDWIDNDYIKYGINFIEQRKGVFYYKPYRYIKKEEIWEICYDSNYMDEIIQTIISSHPFVFENELIAVSYYETYCIDTTQF